MHSNCFEIEHGVVDGSPLSKCGNWDINQADMFKWKSVEFHLVQFHIKKADLFLE